MDLGLGTALASAPSMMRRRARARDGVDEDGGDDDHEDGHARLRAATELHGLVEQEADAAGADHAEYRAGADVDLEAVEPEAHQLRQHLRQRRPSAAPAAPRPPAARAASTGPGSMPSMASAVSLPSVPAEWMPMARAPATRSEAGDGDEDGDGEDDLREGADAVEDLAHRRSRRGRWRRSWRRGSRAAARGWRR